MILRHDFPDIHWLKHQIDRRFKKLAISQNKAASGGWPTVLLHVKTQQTYRQGIRGPFSLFYNLQGTSRIRVDGYSVAVRPGFFFLTNEDQTYDLEIPDFAETFNIHFGEQLVSEVQTYLAQRLPYILDHPLFENERPLLFFNRIYPQSPAIRQLIGQIHYQSQINDLDPIWLEEKLYELLLCLLLLTHKDQLKIDQLPLHKQSTRAEVFKRLSLAVDLIYATYDQTITLEELAASAYFSKFHFLRLFKMAFGQSPYQFISAIRIAKAKEWLRYTDWPIHLIALNIGLENTSSFSRLFCQKTGIYPSEFRKQYRK